MAQLEQIAAPGSEWWRSAVIYQIYPRSFADASGDGIGDLPGITSRLDSLKELGVDAIWLSPFMTSPQRDAGYDVADYRDVDPLFGTLADFDLMLEEAHARDIRVVVDLVPNHSSDQHVWFQEALKAAPGSPERARYIFDATQPDFDWTNEEVREEFRSILRFWLDRGVDGFRVDVAHGMIKADGLPDYTPPSDADSMGGGESNVPYWGQDGVHDIYRD